MLTVAACSSGGSPGGPVVTTGEGRSDATESRGGELEGFTAPALTEPATGDPATGDPATGDPATGDPATGPPATEPASPESDGSLPGLRAADDVAPGAPASAPGAPASTEPVEPCHPSYFPCLRDLPGDALDCSDLDDGLKPVVVLDPADDPYRLAEDTSGRACIPAGLTGLVAEGTREEAPGDAERPRRTPSSSWIPDPEPPDVENLATVCGPGTRSSGFAAVQVEGAGVSSEPGGVSLPPLPPEPPEPGEDSSEPGGVSLPPLPPEPPEPGEDSSEPGGVSLPPLPPEPPEPGEESSDPDAPPSESPESDVAELESDVAESARVAALDEWCLPEPSGDTVRLFWCEDDLSTSPDLEVYEGSGVAPTHRTRPLALQVGTRLERYSTCTGLNAVEEVVGIVEFPGAADELPLLGVHLCGRFFLGEELYSWGLGLYRVWQDAESRYQVEMPVPVEYLGTC